jgi:hypothetical protein
MIEFDGPNQIITLDSGVTSVDALEIYSRWKDWLLEDNNMVYNPAFRTIGGDPISPGINAGIYYFLRNDLGWRIKPPEEHINIFLSGNLVPENFAVSTFIPTNGAYTSAIIGVQPITQNVQQVLLKVEEVREAIVAADYVIATGSTDTIVRTDSLKGNNFYNGLIVMVISASGVSARAVSTYQASNGSFTLSPALPFTPIAGEKLIVLGRVASAAAAVDTGAIASAVAALVVPEVWDYDPTDNTNDDSIMSKIRRNLPK